MAQEKDIPQLSVTTDELVPYIIKQGKALSRDVQEARKKYGSRYNERNKVEEMYSRFGNPKFTTDAEKFAKEFLLILQKKSTLPAAVRYPVRDICQQAMNACYQDKLVRYWKQQEEQKAKETQNPDEQ